MRWILVCFWLTPFLAVAQENAPAGRPPFTLKLAPLNLLNPLQQSFDLRADLPFARRWALEAGLGYIFASAPFALYKGESYQGFKARPVLKFYASHTRERDFYVGLTTRYHGIWNKRLVNTLRQGGLYTEWMTERRYLSVWGAALCVGSQHYFGKQKNWVVESFLGFGWRQMSISRGDLPEDALILFDGNGGFFWQSNDQGRYDTPDLMLGFCIGRRLRG